MEASTSSVSGKQPRQKRVLPSRSRRGGPGVGNCDADVMILETQRRKPENEPLIPADTPFLLTTNSALASTSSSIYQVNVHANERYFERPEVLKAYREQLVIETPEFKSLGDTPVGRLRARSQAGITEDGPVETSDAVYEKRHRKYETFEKRFRLREKEKLKHEQYKLKERIDQLRAMDPTAFLALPEDLFPVQPSHTDPESHDEEESYLDAQVVGGSNYREGERRRNEMLKIAHSIEDRFRVLLPPDRIRKPIGQTAVEPSAEPEFPSQVIKGPLVIPDAAPVIETVRGEGGRFGFKIKLAARSNKPASAKQTLFQKSRQSDPPLKQKKASTNVEMPIAAAVSHADVDGDGGGTPPPISHIPHATSPSPSMPPPYRSVTPPPQQHSVSLPATPMSNPDIVFLRPDPCSPEAEATHDDEATSTHISVSTDLQGSNMSVASRPSIVSRPHKRVKLSPTTNSMTSRHASRETSVPPIASISVPRLRHRSPSHASTIQSSRRHGSYAGAPERQRHGLLVTQAIRSSSSKTSKGQRHLYAFGGKVQNELFIEEREFELPHWVRYHSGPYSSSKRSRARRHIDTDEYSSQSSPSYVSEDELSD
ncbi:hypothetical protein DXG01_009914 [Tephrocybe rancida]|nr:hypothetical protein DXG01_009914 [Tephrocybe rancida]